MTTRLNKERKKAPIIKLVELFDQNTSVLETDTITIKPPGNVFADSKELTRIAERNNGPLKSAQPYGLIFGYI